MIVGLRLIELRKLYILLDCDIEMVKYYLFDKNYLLVTSLSCLIAIFVGVNISISQISISKWYMEKKCYL